MSFAVTKAVSSGICRRASATGPPSGLLAFILSMHAGIVAPGANTLHAAFSASWLRTRSVLPACSSVASGTSTFSVILIMREKRSAPRANPCVAVGRWLSSHAANSFIALEAAADAWSNSPCNAGLSTPANAFFASPV